MKRCLVLGALIGVGTLSIVLAGFQAPPAGPTKEALTATKIDAHVEIFNCLKMYRDARLLRTVDKAKDNGDLYFACINGTGARLTGLGRFYWKLAHDGRI